MSSPIGSIRNVKIFVLYLMENIGYPMDYVTINDVVMQNDYVMYLDFAEAFAAMLDDGLIVQNGEDEQGAPLYEVSDHGRCVAEELHSDLLPVILRKSMRCALRYLDFRKRGVTIQTDSEKVADGQYRVTFRMIEKKQEIFSTSLIVDSESRVEEMKVYFREHPEAVYKGTHALLSGDVDYLF